MKEKIDFLDDGKGCAFVCFFAQAVTVEFSEMT